MVAVGVHNDGIPVYTFTSEQKGIYSEPDLAYISLIRDATRRVCDQYDISVDCGLETALILMARIDDDLPVIGIDPAFVKIKRRRKNKSFNAIYIECDYKIGKTNADAQEEKARNRV